MKNMRIMNAPWSWMKTNMPDIRQGITESVRTSGTVMNTKRLGGNRGYYSIDFSDSAILMRSVLKYIKKFTMPAKTRVRPTARR